MKKTKKLAAAALTAAIACAVMLAGALLPAGRLAVPAVASLAMFAAYIECGRLYGLLSYGASAALALRRIGRIRHLLKFVQHEIGDYERPAKEPGLRDIRNAAVNDHRGV